jgi:hypothetical protein
MTMKTSLADQFDKRTIFPGQPCAKAGDQGKRRNPATLGSRFHVAFAGTAEKRMLNPLHRNLL